ncbi:threonylcarbamoyl-AMP synthase [Pajaroellobacter abortibovis]|uniref:Threonylcarbamoyl-AMP synthase n=2 Tax=Pajaroellobacter abortibovis TaxID=1882918 RepID=A0A1L6MUY2_9BACT|nr:threonylcarbamoyl-AMP synthase [Pajaroellobacter abortibovis]
MLLSIHSHHPEPQKINRAVDLLLKGEVIAYPTDTVYGLGCDCTNRKALEKLSKMKQLDNYHLFTFLCDDFTSLSRFAVVETHLYRILRRFLPGPYCFILPATREVPRMLQSKRKTVGLRIPSHPVPIAISRILGRPLFSTTAALPHEGISLIDPQEIRDAFPTLSMVLDGGTGGQIPSSVIDMTSSPPQVLREGAGSVAEFYL